MPKVAHLWNPLTAAGRALLDAQVTQQAQIIAFSDDFRLVIFLTLAALPLLLILGRGARMAETGSAAAE